MKNPPILIAIIGFFALLGGFGYLFFGLRALGFDWFGALGDLPAFDHVGLWGWLAIVTGLIWIVAALGLWALQPWARLFALIIAGFALFEAVLAFFQFPGQGIGFAMALTPILILWYLTTSEVKVAFGLAEPATTSARPASAATPAPAAFAAAAARPGPAAAAPAPVAAAPAVVAAAAVASTSAAPMAPAAAPMAPAAAPAAAAVTASAAPMAPAAAPMAPAAAPAAAAASMAAAATPPPAAAASATGEHMNIVDVEGIGPAHAEKLAAVGIRTTDDLLMAGATPAGRNRVAEGTGIGTRVILDWVNKVDLMRVPGVGPQYSDLLEAAGVDSPAELAQRNPTNLAVTVQEVVAARPGIVRRIPSEAEIAAWVDEARKLNKIVEH